MIQFGNHLRERLEAIRYNIAESAEKANKGIDEISLMAVTKTIPVEIVNEAIGYGINLLGENRVQELLDKYDGYKLKKDGIHFIGHLQTNKVKYIIDKVSMIESVDSIKLSDEVNAQAKKYGIIMPVLLEVNISSESTKSGFLKEELHDALAAICDKKNLDVCGLMCIPEKGKGEYHFAAMQSLFLQYSKDNFFGGHMQYLSMGMSADYQAAILHGANIIRIGSAMFGER